jgi:hypothetical protein
VLGLTNIRMGTDAHACDDARHRPGSLRPPHTHAHFAESTLTPWKRPGTGGNRRDAYQ